MYKSYLPAYSRGKWVVKNHDNEGCLFCRIAKGDKKVPKRVLYKDEKVMVIMNLFPYNVGHLQVIPIRHVVNIESLKEDEFIKLFSMVKKTVKLLKKVLNPDGINIGINMGGEPSGASIKHLHIHIVPRYKRDAGFMEIIANTKVVPISLDETYKKLKKEIKILKE